MHKQDVIPVLKTICVQTTPIHTQTPRSLFHLFSNMSIFLKLQKLKFPLQIA